jgi:hypothetical protein
LGDGLENWERLPGEPNAVLYPSIGKANGRRRLRTDQIHAISEAKGAGDWNLTSRLALRPVFGERRSSLENSKKVAGEDLGSATKELICYSTPLAGIVRPSSFITICRSFQASFF